MEEYFTGKKLYGDDFTPEQIKSWYEEESEGYADLGAKEASSYEYHYHTINKAYGFSKIKCGEFNNVLGFGSAWGFELLPVINKIKHLTIVEPSDNMRSEEIMGLIPEYIKPEVNGTLPFSDNSFDLITCLGVLHHIPNVSHVLSELIRVLLPGGHILLREPIGSMGDWRKKRQGLTKNERGISDFYLDLILSEQPVKIVSKKYCFTATSLLQRKLKRLLKKPLCSYKAYVFIDKWISAILYKNTHYHPQTVMQKIAPSSLFYVIVKTS